MVLLIKAEFDNYPRLLQCLDCGIKIAGEPVYTEGNKGIIKSKCVNTERCDTAEIKKQQRRMAHTHSVSLGRLFNIEISVRIH